MGWMLPLLSPQPTEQQLSEVHRQYRLELEQRQQEATALERRVARMAERFASHLHDVRRRHLLRLCWQAFRSH
eukprot:1984180-Prymnesium_polylepis.1